jgi:hypothetical protein
MGDCSHPCPTTHPPQQELLLQHGHPDSGPGRPKAKGCPSSEATSGRFWAPPTNASYLVRCMYVGGTGCPERSRLAPKRGLGLAVCWAALGAFSDKMGLDVVLGLEVPAQCRSVQHSRRPPTECWPNCKWRSSSTAQQSKQAQHRAPAVRSNLRGYLNSPLLRQRAEIYQISLAEFRRRSARADLQRHGTMRIDQTEDKSPKPKNN